MGRELIDYYNSGESHRNKIGEKIIDYMFCPDSPKEIARTLIQVLGDLKTEEEWTIADNIFIAITGWSLETLYADLLEEN